MTYISRIKDKGTRKVMTLRAYYGYDYYRIGKILGIASSTAEKIGKRGALKVREQMYKDMAKKGMIFGQRTSDPQQRSSKEKSWVN